MTLRCCSSSAASFAIPDTLSLTTATFSEVSWIRLTVCPIESVILTEVVPRFASAAMIRLEDSCVSVLKFRISSATTANPFPASPALAASIDAFNASRFVWELMDSMVLTSVFTRSNSFWNSERIVSTSSDSFAISIVVSATLDNSPELSFAWSADSFIRVTICSIRDAMRSTCSLMLVVMSIEDIVLS